MLGDITAANEIYIVTGRTDMRKSIDGLCAIVEDQLHMDPKRSALYLFCGKRCDRIKALLWEEGEASVEIEREQAIRFIHDNIEKDVWLEEFYPKIGRASCRERV